MNQHLRTVVTLALMAVVPPAIAVAKDNPSPSTSLMSSDCAKRVDKTDPNDTPYLECPGVGGYKLIKRNADGRQSIDVVTPNGDIVALNYWDTVTRHFSDLGDKAQWRLGPTGAPVAVIVPVESHEDSDEPDRVTHHYLAVAKITAQETCVTDRRLAGSPSPSKIKTKCLPPLEGQ